jgi:hypothetical protein|nr:MAG TPA: hypothetical protein [Caudoviricetes sp.]
MDVSKFNLNGQEINIKDSTARENIVNINKELLVINYDAKTETITINKKGV